MALRENRLDDAAKYFAGASGTGWPEWVAGRKHAEGAAKIVWVDRATQRSTPLPDAVRSLLG